MTFALSVLGQGTGEAERIFNRAALVVFCSIIAEGVTDTPGSEWMARRAERSEEARAGCSAVPAEVGGRDQRAPALP